MLQKEKADYHRFLEAFARRYEGELKYVGLVSEEEILWLYVQFKGSGKAPEEWLEEQELS